VRAVAAKADLRLVGIGQMDQSAQVFVDGFVSREELLEIMRLGAVGELTVGRSMERAHHQGRHQCPADQYSAASPCRGADHRGGCRSWQGCGDQGGAEGRLINGLITDEATASAILKP